MNQAADRFQIMHASRALIGQKLIKATTNEPPAAYDLAQHLYAAGAIDVEVRDTQTGKLYSIASFKQEFGVQDA